MDIIELTDEQKLLLLKTWQEREKNPPSISELVKLCFPDAESFDGRTKEGRTIRAFLSEKGLEAVTTEFRPKGLIELTPEQKEYISNNCVSMKSLEMARVLFDNPKLAATSQEARTVFKYTSSLDSKILFDREENIPTEDYKPPKIVEHVVARINKHVNGANYDSKKLTPTQKKQCVALISYMHNLRFIHYMNLIENADDRRLFENTFVKYIYNKNDLSQEDLDQYLALANEAVTESSIKRTIAMLEQEQQRSLDETNRISMTIVEAIKTSRDEYNACRNRQDKLYKALEMERSKRMDGKLKDNATILNLIEAWKQKDQRDKMVQLANKRQEKLSNEIDRLENMDELKARILGISKGEILEG